MIFNSIIFATQCCIILKLWQNLNCLINRNCILINKQFGWKFLFSGLNCFLLYSLILYFFHNSIVLFSIFFLFYIFLYFYIFKYIFLFLHLYIVGGGIGSKKSKICSSEQNHLLHYGGIQQTTTPAQITKQGFFRGGG